MMVIDKFCLNVPPGKGPVEIIGQLDEMSEVARLFGWRNPASWRVMIFSVIDHARGKTPNVLLTRNESAQLCRIAAATAMRGIEGEFMESVPDLQAATVSAESSATDGGAPVSVLKTILSYASTDPPRHEQL